MAINAGMFSSNTDMWGTPIELFRQLDNEFHFNTDVCAVASNAKCSHYYSPEQNGLEQEWTGICFMNPPYGRQIGKWVKKAYESTLRGGTTVVCLLPSRTDTKWFQDYCLKASDIRFIRGRLHFNDAKNSAPFPSVVVVFDGKNGNQYKSIDAK